MQWLVVGARRQPEEEIVLVWRVLQDEVGVVQQGVGEGKTMETRNRSCSKREEEKQTEPKKQRGQKKQKGQKRQKGQKE